MASMSWACSCSARSSITRVVAGSPQMRRYTHTVGRFQLQQNLLQGGIVGCIHDRHVQPGDRVAGSRSSSNRIARVQPTVSVDDSGHWSST
jgi:hypothetical protein